MAQARRARGIVARVGMMILAAVLLAARGVAAQDATPTPRAASRAAAVMESETPVVLYAGPGETYEPLGEMDEGQRVTIVERNRVGTWVHVVELVELGGESRSGWMLAGMLVVDESLDLATVRVNTALPDADLERIVNEQLEWLYSAPVVPSISPQMAEVYRRGVFLGNRPNRITKIGDSVTADPLYLGPMNRGDHQLGPYQYLDATIDFFGPATDYYSVAANIGFNTFTIFDPFWADPNRCQRNETPLDCEYRIRRPSVAFIMFGPNDVLHFELDEYTTQMRMMVEDALERGVIPVLSTFSYHPDLELWSKAVEFNMALVDLSAEYHVPLINLWLAARPLPDFGLEGDFIHMKHWGARFLKFDDGEEARYGLALRNLLSIYVLDELRRTLEMGVE